MRLHRLTLEVTDFRSLECDHGVVGLVVLLRLLAPQRDSDRES